MQQIFKGRITADDNSDGLIFMHPNMIEALSECTQLFCDGTFKVHLNRIFIYMNLKLLFTTASVLNVQIMNKIARHKFKSYFLIIFSDEFTILLKINN